jgi:L-threonylcarbamoyladenylate synthase
MLVFMSDIKHAAAIVKNGGIVGFPTETVYGLGANAFDAKAVAKIFAAKGRPADNPLIVHICDEKMLSQLTDKIPASARVLMKKYWPGPLTILFKKSENVPAIVTAGLDTVAVRMPNHAVALHLIRESGVPIAAPSANKSGKPSPTTARHVREDFPDVFVLDGDSSEHGVESTVISLEGTPKVLRLGPLTLESLRKIIPDIELAHKPDASGKVTSPGMKYKHYAPKQPLIVFAKKQDLVNYAKSHPNAVVLCKYQDEKLFKNNALVLLGATNDDIAHNLYAALRCKKGSELLICAVPRRGIGKTIMDRLERAASRVV